MQSKNLYFILLKEDDGRLNEIDLGEKIGLNKNDTNRIISQLLMEHKIKYERNRACNYKILRKNHLNKG